MVYYHESMVLDVVATLLRGDENSVLVSVDRASPMGAKYTLLVVSDHQCIKRLLAVLDASKDGPPYLFSFAQNDELIFGFPFQADRRFSAFATNQILGPVVGEQVCINLVMECISTPFPAPLLMLILDQDAIHITKENDIYFTPTLDLSALDPEITEKDCTVRCAQIILELLEGMEKKRRKLKSFELIRRKIQTHSFSAFTELYRDIRLTAIPGSKTPAKVRLRAWWRRNKDGFFKVLLGICVLALAAAVIMLISQLIYGDIPLLRLFKHCFDVIGTENLR